VHPKGRLRAVEKVSKKSLPLKVNLNPSNLVVLNLKTHYVRTVKIFNTPLALSIAKKYSWGAIRRFGFSLKGESVKNQSRLTALVFDK
jgi:hypothetical protein